MAEDRLPRDLNTREVSQRKRTWTPPTTLPEPAPQEGWVFRWIRASMLGTNDPTNVSSKFREGWEPCKATDHPELMLNTASTPNSRGNIEIGGLILCKAPVEMVEQRAEYFRRQAKGQMEAVDNNYMRENDQRMPLFSEKKSTVSFGKGK